MKYCKLNNGIMMPLLGLGTWNLNGQECIQTVCNAIQSGYQLIDTAQMYGNEKEVGEGIKKSGALRDKLFITTKIYRKSNSYEKAKQAINDSLMNLNTDYIDLMLLHEPYVQGPQMYKALEEAYHDGKVRAIGISNYDPKWFQEFLTQCNIPPAVNQVETHLYFQKWNVQEALEAHNVKMQAWAPLAQGKEDMMNHPVLTKLSKKYNKTVPQIILRFLTQRGISVIPKTKRSSRLMENITIFDFQLTDTEINSLKKLDRNQTLFPWTENF